MFRNYDQWLPLKEVRYLSDARLEARVRLDHSSEWFSGHFDGIPVMPAVSLLSLVGQLPRRQGHKEGRNLEVSGFRKVRIKRIVIPDEELHISVASMPPDSQADLDFLVTSQGRTVAKGVIKITEDLV